MHYNKYLSCFKNKKIKGPGKLETIETSQTREFCCCFVAMLHSILCDLMDCGPLGSSAHGISQARILEWVAIFFSRGSSRPEIEPVPPGSAALSGRFFTTESPGTPPESFYKNTTKKDDKIETCVTTRWQHFCVKSYYHLLTQNTWINDVVFFICLKLSGCFGFSKRV